MEHFFPEFRWRRWRPKNKKKKVFTRNGALFLSTALRSDAHQSQIIGGDADENHTQIAGGYTVKLLGGIYPQSPRVSAPLFMAFMLDVQQLIGTVWRLHRAW